MPSREEIERFEKILHDIKWRTQSGYIKLLAEEAEQILKRVCDEGCFYHEQKPAG